MIKNREKSFKMEKELICPVYKKCNGCQLMNMPYEQQLSWKQNKVKMPFTIL